MTQANTPALTSPRPASSRFSAIAQVLAVWAFRRQSRSSLARLAPHHLRDIGLDPLSARAESVKPFWKD